MTVIFWHKLQKHCGALVCCVLCIGLLLQGCAGVAPVQSNVVPGNVSAGPPADFLMPKGLFVKPVAAGAAVAKSTPLAPSPLSFMASAPSVAEVLVYASPVNQAYFAKGNLDTKANIRVWDVFLRKYKIPFKLLTSVDQLEQARPGVLLLPSSVALSEREKQAVLAFRAKGGGVLASWLTGVRSESGEWLGFGFMESALDTQVVGSTEADEDDNFMMPHGDNPVTHYLPAGLRVWLERAKEWYPLRLVGRYPAAQIMDWSRTFVPGKIGTAIVFDERAQPSGKPSRSVVLGYPERLWLASDPKLLEALAHNALMWLLRQPDAFVAAWPSPYTSAFVMAVAAHDVIAEVDFNFAKLLEDAGGRATYYLLSENAKKSASVLNRIQARGHEVAFLADRYKGFRDQSSAEQSKRFDTMRNEFKDAGIDAGSDLGFHAPMESYDKTTEKILKERTFGYYISFMDATDSRLPFISPPGAGVSPQSAKALVVLPRTQNGPEDVIEDGDGGASLQAFLNEVTLAEQMSGLSVIRIPNQTLLSPAQQAEIFKSLKARQATMWITPARQVAQWWRERERVSAQLVSGAAVPQLKVTIQGDGPLQQSVAVWVNLPEAGTNLRLVARGSAEKLPKIVQVDAWRSAVILQGLTPADYQWEMYFDRPIAPSAQ